jgi:TonB family protein
MCSLHEYIGQMHNDEGGNVVSFRTLKRGFAAGLLLLIAIGAPEAWGQEIGRKVKSRVAPQYPDLARRMNIVGVVKVIITVAPNGSVKDAKVVGGHPVLANAALDAVRKWRFEPGPQEATGIVEFHFDPAQ